MGRVHRAEHRCALQTGPRMKRTGCGPGRRFLATARGENYHRFLLQLAPGFTTSTLLRPAAPPGSLPGTSGVNKLAATSGHQTVRPQRRIPSEKHQNFPPELESARSMSGRAIIPQPEFVEEIVNEKRPGQFAEAFYMNICAIDVADLLPQNPRWHTHHGHTLRHVPHNCRSGPHNRPRPHSDSRNNACTRADMGTLAHLHISGKVRPR